MRNSSLTHVIPYYAYHDGVTLNVDGSLFIGMKLSGLESHFVPLDELKALKDNFKNIFHILPPGTTVQIIQDYDEPRKNFADGLKPELKSTHPMASLLRDSYTRRLNTDKNQRSASVYLFLIRPKKTHALTNIPALWDSLNDLIQQLKRRSKKDSFVKEESLSAQYEREAVALHSQAQQVIHGLKMRLNVGCQVLSEHDLYTLIYRHLNPKQELRIHNRVPGQKTQHPNYFASYQTMREYLTRSSCEIHSDHLVLNKIFERTMTLSVPPRFTHPSDAESLLDAIDFPFIYSLSFTILDISQTNARLSMQQKRKHAFLSKSENPSIDSSLAKDEIEQALSDQKKQGFAWLETSISFVLFADSEEILDQRANSLRSHFRNYEDAIVEDDRYGQLKYFVASLPGCSHMNDKRFLLSSLNVADLAPLCVPPAGMRQADCYLETHRHTHFRYSTFSDEFNSWNQIIIGKIGSGKSFLANYLLNLSLLSIQDPRVMILDLGGSFRRTVELWGGRHMTIDLDDPGISLNPLCPAGAIFKDGELINHDLMDFTLEVIMMMCDDAESEKERRVNRRLLRSALLKTYQRLLGKTPILSDLQETLVFIAESNDPYQAQARSLAQYLEEFTMGSYQNLFNRDSSFDVSSKFFCFDFKNAHSNTRIRELATYIIGGMILRKIVENAEPKIIIFDEFATTMKHTTGQVLCSTIAKNCRKHGAAFIAISQELSDFLTSPAAQTVFHQANLKFFLKISDDLVRYQEHLRLTDMDIKLIQGLETMGGHYAQTVLFYGDKRAVLTLKPDPVLYWLCTSDPLDKRMEAAYSRKFPERSLDKNIQHLAEVYPYGVDLEDLEKNPFLSSNKEETCVE